MELQLPDAPDGNNVVDGSAWNRLLSFVRWCGKIRAVPPLYLRDSGAGRVIGIAALPRVCRMQVTALASPGDTDQQIVKIKHFDGMTQSGDEVYCVTINPHQVGDEFLAVQPAGGTFDDASDSPVDHDGNPVTWMEQDAQDRILVKVTGNLAGSGDQGGQYDGKICSGAMTAAGTRNYTLPAGLSPGQNCLILNDDESGQSTHWIETDSYTEGVYGGMSTETPSRPIIRVLRGKYRTASPQSLAAGTGETAQTDTWSRGAKTSGTDYGDTPVTVQALSRVVYNAAGDKILYRYSRALTYACDGRLDSVGAETRSVVDTPDTDCT